MELLEVSPSPGSAGKHVVIVTDGTREFTTEPLQWTLDNVVSARCTVTLLGVMPWICIPPLLKTKDNFWTLKLEDVHLLKEKIKLQAVIDLCRRYGVMPQKKTVMGYPPKLLVCEQIVSLTPTWVIFDRYGRKDKKFYARRIPCNILMMDDDGRVDMVKSHHDDRNVLFGVSPASSANTPHMTVSCESTPTSACMYASIVTTLEASLETEELSEANWKKC